MENMYSWLCIRTLNSRHFIWLCCDKLWKRGWGKQNRGKRGEYFCSIFDPKLINCNIIETLYKKSARLLEKWRREPPTYFLSYKEGEKGKVRKLLFEQNIVDHMYFWLCIRTLDTSHGFVVNNYDQPYLAFCWPLRPLDLAGTINII